MFFVSLHLPVIKKFQDERENYYYNVFQYDDNYRKDVFKEALDKADGISLKNAILDSFISSRQIWTPFLVKNTGNATAKNVQVMFQAGKVSSLHELVETNLNQQGISYSETRDTVNHMYIPDSKNNLLGIPILKPDGVKIIVIKSLSLMPENEILQVKDYMGEEINKTIIQVLMWIIVGVWLIYGIALSKIKKKVS